MHWTLIIILFLSLQGITAFNRMLELAKETNEIFCAPTAHSVSDFKLIALEKRLTGNPIECWGRHYDGPHQDYFLMTMGKQM
jgi:hypothetical protein